MAKMYEDCLNEAVLAKKISEKTAKELKKFIADAEKEAIEKGFPEGTVSNWTFASSKGAERMMSQIGRKKEVLAHDILMIDRLAETAAGHTHGLFRGLEAILGEFWRGGNFKEGLHAQRQAAYRILGSGMTDFIEALRSKNLGLTRDVVHPRDTVIELTGRSSGNAGAAVNAQAWLKVNELWRTMMEAEKVFIRKLEDWFLPQQFNTLKVRQMGPQGFHDAMHDRWVDGRLQLHDFESTGDAMLAPGLPEAEKRFTEIILGSGSGANRKTGAYDNIISHGNASLEPGAPVGQTMEQKYNRRRVFKWRDSDAYFDFQDTFGLGTHSLGDQFMAHYRNMANDLGTARTLGGDPEKTKKILIDIGRKNGLTDHQINALETTYFHASGQAQNSVNVTLSNLRSTVTLWLTGTHLSSAILGSFPDLGFLKSEAAWLGLDFTRMMSAGVAQVAGNRRWATQVGLMAETGLRGLRDHFSDVSLQNGGNLFTAGGMEAASAGMARFAGHAAEVVMRGTGLEAWSNLGRNILGHEILSRLGDYAHLPLDRVPTRFRQQFLEKYGIDAAGWDILRSKAMYDEKLFMDPARLGRETTDGAERTLAFRLMGAVDAEAKFGIPEGSIVTRRIILGQTKPGEIAGEARRLIQFKGFSMSVMMLHGGRMIDNLMRPDGTMMRGQYLASLTIAATLLGALSYQMKNLAQGKDPESMDSAMFWAKAFAMGGAGGMWSDQLKTMFQTKSAADFGRVLSPAAGLGLQAGALAFGNLAQGAEGENANFGREAAQFARKFTLPRLWYTNLAFDRLVWDTLQRAWDKDAAGAFSRIEQRLRKETGTGYFWRPGQDEPSRWPQ